MGTFIGGKVWPEVIALARACRRRRRVAVAYLGADSTEVLLLRRRDVLVVAAMHANAWAGAINPDSLQAYLELGVEKLGNGTTTDSSVPVPVAGTPRPVSGDKGGMPVHTVRFRRHSSCKPHRPSE